MAGPGDSLLIRAGLIRADQLAEAQKLRARGGGSTGEWLVRLGAVTEDQLVDFYHRRLMVPKIQAPQLARVPSQVLLAVPAEMATEFLVFPVSIDPQGALTLAMADPADTHVAEEVAFYSGRACHRAVAAASHLREAIDKGYRLRGQSPLVSAREVRSVPVIEPPEQQYPAEERARSSGTAPFRAMQATPAVAEIHEEPVLLTRPKSEAPRPPEASAVPVAVGREPSAPGRARSVTQSRMPGPLSRPPTPAPLELPVPLSKPILEESPRGRTLPGIPIVPDLPIDPLRGAENRDEVVSILLAYAEQLAPVAALLVMRRGSLAGHDARGPSLQIDRALERFRALVIPLDEPSLFRDVVQSQLPYRGPLPDAPAHRAIVGTLGRLPGEVLLLPISVGGKTIAVLYAAGIGAPLPDPALRELADEAGAAYERLIRSRKQ